MKYYLLIPFLPLAAFLINILLGKEALRDKAHWPSVLAIIGSFVISVMTLFDVIHGKIINEDLYTWIVSGNFKVSFGFLHQWRGEGGVRALVRGGSLVHIPG